MTPGSEIRTTSSREVYANQWLRLREDTLEYADGSPGLYTVIEKDDFVLVIPYENEGFWLVEQFRYTVQRREWEFPQGGWPAGSSGTQAELARAELSEETGFRAGRLEHLGRLWTAYGFSPQAYDVYLAAELESGTPHRERTEADMVQRWFPAGEVRAMIGRGELMDAHSVAALALFDLRPTA